MGAPARFREFLRAKRSLARLENRLFDWAYIKNQWRPIKNCRRIVKGRKKGQIEVTLFEPPGKIRIVPANYVKLVNREVNQENL